MCLEVLVRLEMVPLNPIVLPSWHFCYHGWHVALNVELGIENASEKCYFLMTISYQEIKE